MRLHHVLFFGLLSPAIRAVAAESVPELPTVPSCAVWSSLTFFYVPLLANGVKRDCQQQLLTNHVTSCSSTNTSCLCADEKYQNALSTCALANCTMRDSLTAKYVGSRQCNIPITHRYAVVDGGTLAPFILASLLFVLRIVAKTVRLGGGWGPDDFTLITAYALAIMVFSLNASMVHFGFGMNMWDIWPQENITKAYKRFFAYTLIYKATISLAKISVCLFLLRIFQSRLFRCMAYTIIAINSAVAVVWILVDSLHCIPVHLAWTQWEGLEQGKCINFTSSTFANGFVNIAVDTVMVIMPIYEVTKLNLSFRKKVGVALMFAMGLLLTAMGIVRVVVFSNNDSNDNPAYEMQALNYWSTIECQIAIICACLPTTRAMLVHFLPRMFGVATEEDSRGQPYAYQGGASTPGAGTAYVNDKSHISKTMTVSVDYSSRSHRPQQRHSGSFVQLVEMDTEHEHGAV